MRELLSSCQLCPRRCRVNRLQGETGFCGATGSEPKIYSYQVHWGEEPPLTGTGGSGTIFFSHCHGRCVYCQNYHFSCLGQGKTVAIMELVDIMLQLQGRGVHNINLVTPTHFVPQIIEAAGIARDKGLTIPIVYNTNGYELPETLELLKGIVDIYLPDMRYSSDAAALKYSMMPGYVPINRQAVKIMHDQTGDLVIKDGAATRGLIIRLLVLPNRVAGVADSLRFIKEEIGTDVYLSLMEQYYPVFQANQYPEIARQITVEEYQEVRDIMIEYGFTRGWCQDKPEPRARDRFLGVNLDPQI